MHRFWQIFSTADLPEASRRNYRLELSHYLMWICLVGVIDPNVNAIVASKTFGAPGWLAAFIWSIPVLANLLNVVWGVILRGRRRVRMMVLLSLGVVVSVAALGLVPREPGSPWGAALYCLLLAVVFTFWSGLVTLRTSLWQMNYPGTHRARVAGRLQVVRLCGSLAIPITLGLIFDKTPDAYRFVYPAAAVVGLLSLIPLSRIRVANEDEEIASLRQHLTDRGQATSGRSGFFHGLRETFGILRLDKLYRNYLSAQFLLGSANFFTDPVLNVVLTQQIGLGYAYATIIMTSIRTVTMLVLTPWWSELFDRMGIFRFRVLNSSFWVAAHSFVAVGMIVFTVLGPGATAAVITLIVLARVFAGIGAAGGMIAWPLGHLAFSSQHDANLYLSVHVALTGVRGLVMPHLSTGLNVLVGNPSFVAAVLLAVTGHLLYRRLLAQENRKEAGEPSQELLRDPTAPPARPAGAPSPSEAPGR
jgi:hypothetical protein